MCGICGFANYKSEPLLKAMTARLAHRGPDEDGFFSEGGNVSLGMRRLKIIDLATGSQPIASEDGAVNVVFNGEIYNFKELRAELEGKGHRFRTSSDTEVLVHLYEEYGADFPARLRGMFAFALWDAKTAALLLARDQFGIKPLFYSVLGDKLFFASEMKSLLAFSGIPRELDLTALDAYFARLYIPSPLTIYRHIKKLEPAQRLIFRSGRAEISAYWSLPEFAPSVGTEAEYLEGMDDLLGRSVAEQLMSDVPLGLLLSGGMDSSSILYYMSRASKKPVKTFTIGYGSKDPSFNETVRARMTADFFRADHHEAMLEPDVRGLMEKLAAQFDEPFADASAMPTYLVTGEARKKVTVALTGIGGDELFGGYPRYLGARLLPAYMTVPGIIRRGLWAGARYIPESAGSRNLPGRLKRFLKGGALDFRACYKSWLTYFTEEERLALYGPRMSGGMKGPPHRLPGRLEGPEDIFRFELRNYLSDDLLALADRTSMANSLELRVPFLDIRLVEFMSSAPLSLKTRGFRLKYLLKKLMAGRIPDEVIKGGKKGFQVPLARWQKEEIKDFVKEALSPEALKRSGYLAPEYVARMLREHESGRRNLNDQIHAAMMFELWLATPKPASVPMAAVLSIHGPPKNILLLNMAGLGDIIMMSPVLKALRISYPSCRISVLTIERSAGLAALFPEISEVFSIPVRYRLPNLFGLWRGLKTFLALRQKHFDVLIDLKVVSSRAGAGKRRFINKLIRPGFSAGRCDSDCPGLFDRLYKEPVKGEKSEVELSARLLEALGIVVKDFNISLPVRAEDRAFAEGELAGLGASGRKLVGINPGAFRPSRRWPLENWKELINLILDNYPDVAIVVNGSVEEAAEYAGLKISERVIVLDGRYKMGQLAAIFERMSVFITNDTGPMHLAAAVGAKVVAIFGPGDVIKFKPSVPEERLRIVRKDIPGCVRPCYKFKCPAPACLTAILPAEVFGKARELLDGRLKAIGRGNRCAVSPVANPPERVPPDTAPTQVLNDIKCPACGAREASLFRRDLNRCPACGLVWARKQHFGAPVYEEGMEKDIYGGGKSALFERCLRALARRFPSRGKLLDVGSAYGGFMGMAKAGGWAVEGVEIDPKMVSAASAAGLKIHTRPLVELQLPAASYDAVTVFEVLSQMDDPAAALKEIYRALKPGGLVYIREFNGAFHMALEGRRIFEVLGVRPAVTHNFNFTVESLRRTLALAGFKNVRIRNSRPTTGDPYCTGGRLGPAFTGFAKFMYHCLVQIVYYASFGRLLAGSSFIVEAEK